MKRLSLLVFVVAALAESSGASAQLPPAAHQILWVRADAGVVADANGVALWEDQSPSNNDAVRTLGTMQQATASFGNGTHDVIRFNKDGFFSLNSALLRVPDLTVFAVVEQTGQERRSYLSNYSNAINFGYGFHLDMEGSSTRAFTSAGTGATLSDFATAGPSAGMHLLTTSISTTNHVKTIDADGTTIGGPTPVPNMTYFNADTASIGALGQLQIDFFYMRGDIAEILVYDTVDPAQTAAVEDYLNNKYFVPEPATTTIAAFGATILVGRLRRRASWREMHLSNRAD